MSTIMHGYIDRTGSFVVPRSLNIADSFSGGVAMAEPLGSPTFGFVDTRGEWVIAPKIQWYGGASNGVHTYNIGGQRDERGTIVGGDWGLAGEGRNLVEPRFAAVGSFAEGRIAVEVDGRWGFAEKRGEVVIEPRYEWAGTFSDGIAVVVIDGKDAYIGLDGSIVLPPQDTMLYTFVEGRGRCKQGDQWFLIDIEGGRLSAGYDEIWPLKGGMAQVKKGDQYGFIGSDGSLIGDRMFDEGRGWGSGLAPVRSGDQWFVLGVDGQLHGPYQGCGGEGGGFVAIVTGEGVGYRRADGFVIEPRFQSGNGFKDGRAGVQREDKWTFVDRDGREIHEPRWDAIGSISDGGEVPTRLGPRWGVCTTDGEVLAAHGFTRIGDFSEGLASAQRLRWDREIDPPPHGVTAMPEGGLTHPVFADAGVDDDLRMTVMFEPTLDEDQLRRLRQLTSAARSAMDARAVGGPSLDGGRFWLCDYALSMRFQNLPRPVLAVDLILDEIRDLHLPIKELAFFLLRDDPDVPPAWQLMFPFKPAAKHPEDPLGPTGYPDFSAYWQAVWDADRIPPRSENLFYLRVARFDREMNVMQAERMLSLHVPGVRVCMGTMQVPEAFIERTDDRRTEVEAVLGRKLAQRFAAERIWVPPFVNPYKPPSPARSDWSPGVMTIEYEGRKGYSFAIDPPHIIQDVGPDVYRYREQELVEAVAEAVAELGLEPVILWQLFGNVLNPNMPHMTGAPMIMAPDFYCLQVWEKAP